MDERTKAWKVSFEKENRGNAWVVGNDISTDDIIPGKFLEIRDVFSLSAHVFERFGEGFATKVKQGDVIVAGNNFGCGSSREQAPFLLRFLGIGAVFARSFARIFYRNAINIGLPAITIDGDTYNAFKPSESVVYTLDPPAITIVRSRKKYPLQPMPAFFTNILRAGGAIPLLKKGLAKE